jgi:hypothetical protein
MSLDRPRGRLPSGEHLGDFVAIERGDLISAREETERLWESGEDLPLRVRDSGGEISVLGKLYVQDLDPSGPALLTVLSSYDGEAEDQLAITLQLFDYEGDRFDTIGTEKTAGGTGRVSRFRTRLTPNDRHIEEGEIRFRLSVSASHPPGSREGYVFSVRAVTLSLRCEGS